MADVALGLSWTREGLAFEGGPEDGPSLRVDGNGELGPSPMETMLAGVAGCTAADIVDILGKMRVPLDEFSIEVEGDRAPEPPRRYVRIRFTYRVTGPAAEDEPKVRRAVELSHEKYCSALHTLRPDLESSTDIVLG